MRWIQSNVPSNFLKSVCTKNFFCATFYQDSSVYGKMCIKDVHEIMCKHIFERKCFVRSKFSSVCSSHNLCTCAHAHFLERTPMSSPPLPLKRCYANSRKK